MAAKFCWLDVNWGALIMQGLSQGPLSLQIENLAAMGTRLVAGSSILSQWKTGGGNLLLSRLITVCDGRIWLKGENKLMFVAFHFQGSKVWPLHHHNYIAEF